MRVSLPSTYCHLCVAVIGEEITCLCREAWAKSSQRNRVSKWNGHKPVEPNHFCKTPSEDVWIPLIIQDHYQPQGRGQLLTSHALLKNKVKVLFTQVLLHFKWHSCEFCKRRQRSDGSIASLLFLNSLPRESDPLGAADFKRKQRWCRLFVLSII